MSIVTLNDRGVRSVTAFGSLNTGSMVFISKQTASSSATISFTSGIDSTYKEYVFTFKDIHAENDTSHFSFQANAAGGSGYNETITSTMFRAQHGEDGNNGQLNYDDNDYDLAQATGFQKLNQNLGNGADECLTGYLHLFNPSSTTFVKHFISRTSAYQPSDRALDTYVAGYFNTTSAIDEIQFKMASGDIDAGDICLYGIL
tara:strand:+ start:23 stop:628 length:606 start_codon:yes stop_codon:yes gene_type:complete